MRHAIARALQISACIGLLDCSTYALAGDWPRLGWDLCWVAIVLVAAQAVDGEWWGGK